MIHDEPTTLGGPADADDLWYERKRAFNEQRLAAVLAQQERDRRVAVDWWRWGLVAASVLWACLLAGLALLYFGGKP